MKKISLLLLATMLVFSFVACSDDDSAGSVAFTEDANSVLKVNHQDNVDIVLFKALPDGTGNGTLLGGVKGNSQGFGVPNIKTTDGLFILNVVTYADYQAAPSNPRVASSFLVYVDSQPATYSIASTLVGSGILEFVNQTGNYVEIRGGNLASNPSIYSPTFTVLRTGERKRMYMPGGDYILFPVMKLVRMSGATIVGMADKVLGNEYARSYSINDGDTLSFTLPSTATAGAVHTVAYVEVVNQYWNGLFMNSGVSRIKNVLDREIINSYNPNSPKCSQFQLKVTSGTSVSMAFQFQDQGAAAIANCASYAFEKGRAYKIYIPTQETGVIPTIPMTATVSNVGTYEEAYGGT